MNPTLANTTAAGKSCPALFPADTGATSQEEIPCDTSLHERLLAQGAFLAPQPIQPKTRTTNYQQRK